MKRLTTIFVLMVFLLSLLPSALSIEDKGSLNKSIGGVRVKASDLQPEKVKSRLNNCANFMIEKNLTDKPAMMCAQMFNEEINCIDFLTEKGVEQPSEKCDNFFKTSKEIVKERRALSDAVKKKIADWRISRMEGFAEKHPNATNIINELPEDKAKILFHMSRNKQAKMMEMLEKDHSKASEKLAKLKLKVINKEMRFKQRSIAQNKLKEAKENFGLAKEEYAQTNRQYKEKRELFLETKEKLKECKGIETEECTKMRETAEGHAKAFLINGAKMMIAHLQKVKTKVEASEELDNETAQEIIAGIDDAIKKLEEAVNQAESAKTKEELQAAAKNISEVWRSIKYKEKLFAARLVHGRVWGLIKRSEHLEDRLEATLTKMKEQGINVEGIEAKVDEFSAKIDSTKENFNKANELLKEAQQIRTDKPTEEEKAQILEKVRQAKELIKNAHNELKDAHKILVQIVRDIKKSGGTVTTEVEDQEEGLAANETYELVEEDTGMMA
ncbi:hypothetical protein HY643_04460 [Candidatus Woesearchaeota archaeon]|nr:hypothetical protein [Candidatus Woesearchaeota archaeon]